jgi:uncharacterized membrane protein
MTKQKQKTIIKDLLQTEDAHLRRLNELVDLSMREEESIVQNLMNPPEETMTRGQLISDKVARFGGSWAFILSFLGILVLWIIFNAISLVQPHFDPYPFILLNLVLSCIAAIQAPVIMMSQNRKEEKDRQRAENDYMINLKSELELRNLHQKVDLLQTEQMHKLMEVQILQLRLLEKLNRKIKNQAQVLAKHTGDVVETDFEPEEKIDFDALWANLPEMGR